MKIYIASLSGITESESHRRINEHVDFASWEAFAESPEMAKQLLVNALEKRMKGALQSLEMARDRLAKAQAL